MPYYFGYVNFRKIWQGHIKIGNETCFTKWTILYQGVIDLPIHPPTSKHRWTSSIKNGPYFLFVMPKHLHLSLVMIIMEFEHIFCNNYFFNYI
jgi:hypothetical protein